MDGVRTRRNFLLAGAAGAAGFAAQALGKITPAEATTGDPVLAGQGTVAAKPTAVSSTDTTYREPAFLGDGAVGVKGQSVQQHGIGLFGYQGNSDGAALYAQGRAIFTNSGRASMVAGQKTIKIAGVWVNPPQWTNVVATLSTPEQGKWVTSAVVDNIAGTVEIILNRPLDTDAQVSWFAFSSDM